MKVHRLYFGLQSPTLTTGQANQLVRDLALIHFPNGHTIYNAEGRWAGVQVECFERTLVVEVWEVAGFGTPPVADMAIDYKELASQESVVLITTPSEAVVF